VCFICNADVGDGDLFFTAYEVCIKFTIFCAEFLGHVNLMGCGFVTISTACFTDKTHCC
jgi:hypothetical protein